MIESDILIESQAARDSRMQSFDSDQKAEEVLRKAKSIIFSAFEGRGVAHSEQISSFYQIEKNYLRNVVSRHKVELESDGLAQIQGKSLKALCSIDSTIKVQSKRLTIWTPRAALRLGMLLRDSPIAVEIRNLLLNMVESGGATSNKERELQLELELQKARQSYQDTGWAIIRETSPAMLAFIRGEQPLVRNEIQYIEQGTGKLVGATARYRILPQLIEDLGLHRNSDKDAALVRSILKAELNVDFETGEGLGKAFHAYQPIVIPEERYQEFMYTAAVKLYGKERLQEWVTEQQQLPDFLANGPAEMLPSAEEEE